MSDAEGLGRLAGLDLPGLALRLDVDAPAGPTAADDPAMMICTSGTTGTPKGVLHAHRFLIGHPPAVETAPEGFPRPGDVGWTPADWARIGGLMDLALACLWFGVPLVARRFAKFEAEAAWRLMVEEKVTAVFLPPTALQLLRQTAEPAGLCLRAVMSGGEALGADLPDWGRAALGAQINGIYGQTEFYLVMASCAGTQEVPPGTPGRAVPGAEVEVQDAAGLPVAVGETGETGEICTRGSPATFRRDWKKPEETAANWRNGWLRTGDPGRVEPDGVVAFVSRDDDVIASAGYRIGPSEIEICLAGHPEVLLCAVTGLPDAVRGGGGDGFVVLPVSAASRAELAAELTLKVRTHLSPHLAPRAVHFVDDLPMTATGRIRRRDLRDG